MAGLDSLQPNRPGEKVKRIRGRTGASGLWAGLDVLPKTTYATDYSYRTDHTMYERLVAAIVAKTPLGDPPHSFNADFRSDLTCLSDPQLSGPLR